jgi:hypothetical protein
MSFPRSESTMRKGVRQGHEKTLQKQERGLADRESLSDKHPYSRNLMDGWVKEHLPVVLVAESTPYFAIIRTP